MHDPCASGRRGQDHRDVCDRARWKFVLPDKHGRGGRKLLGVVGGVENLRPAPGKRAQNGTQRAPPLLERRHRKRFYATIECTNSYLSFICYTHTHIRVEGIFVRTRDLRSAWACRYVTCFLFLFLRTSSARAGRGGGAVRFFFFFFFSCSVDHEGIWPPCKVVSWGWQPITMIDTLNECKKQLYDPT